ncbi:MAG: glycosyltransferase family 39 protein [Endomicrobiaceae bacterium]|nr:glycosyltransferase family 39 protein [Endomicrobiaceae bacterium]
MFKLKFFLNSTFNIFKTVVSNPFIILLFFSFFLNLICVLGKISFLEQKIIVEYMFLVAVLIAGISALFLNSKLKLNDVNICILLGSLSFLFHVTYVLCTSIEEYQYDLYFDNNGGHVGYIFYILNKLTLPNFNFSPVERGMFYHPPLHHIISAIWIRINIFMGVLTKNQAIENLQFLTLFYSGCMIVIFYKLFRELTLKKLALVIPFAIVCFHPQFIMFSGSLNNDILFLALSFATVLFVIKWYKNPNIKNIIKVAILLGLAFITKLLALILIPAVFIIFLIKFLNNKNIEFKKQILIFLLIFIPLGLWYYIYNFIRWDVPFYYVGGLNRLSGLINNYVYVPQKLFHIDFNVFRDIFYNQNLNENILSVLLKTSVFGYSHHGIASDVIMSGNILLYTNIVFIIIAILSGVISILDKTKNYLLKIFLYTIFATNVFLYFMFFIAGHKIIEYEFRFLSFSIFIGVTAIAFVLDKIQHNDSFFVKFYKFFIIILTLIFCLSSIVFYLYIIQY